MKNTFTLFLFLIFISGLTYSQGYVKLGGGYNLGFNSMEIANNTTYSSTGNTAYEAVNGSFGEGANIVGALGYNFSQYISGELGVIYKLSKEFEAKYQFENETSTSTYSGSFWGFVPTLVLNAPLDNVKPFMKVGLLIAIPASEIEVVYSSVYSSGGTAKLTFGTAVDFGLIGGAGILVPLSTKINFIVEFDFTSFTWKPAEAEYTDSEGNTHTIKFEDEWTSNDEFTTGPMFFPFSNVGLNIGVQIGL